MTKDQPRGFVVERGVKGAMRINHDYYQTREEAEAKAARWRASNSIGSYWAEVYDLEDGPLVNHA